MSIGHMPKDWKPRMRFSYCTVQSTRTRPEERYINVTVGGSHISLPDGTRIEPMQVSMRLDDLDALQDALDAARAWLDDNQRCDCAHMDEIN